MLGDIHSSIYFLQYMIRDQVLFSDLQTVIMRNEFIKNRRTRKRKSEDTALVKRRKKVLTVMEVSKRRKKCKSSFFLSKM